MADGGPAPGWYDDQSRAGTLRYWDGSAWTEHTAPGFGPRVEDEEQPARRAKSAWRVLPPPSSSATSPSA